ncbi:hypothetical protein TPHV1_190026 [Treponema phagedenis]|uniref:Uncharacterized protein n=1 Tax=Treponema phagedenis TaxID=162 RepID=A0A0B7GS38_TREPH|nr:hypothetical protein TPHV1_190026 [Treponema phagedenis]
MPYGKFTHRCQTQNKFKRCLKASIQNYKIEAFKLAGLVFATDVKTQNGHGRPWFHAETMF